MVKYPVSRWKRFFRIDPRGSVIPLWAISYQAEPISKTITIGLRKGVKFHDGSNFNAAVVKWNLEQSKASGKAPNYYLTATERYIHKNRPLNGVYK
jgi:ABC-type transport system substrate-binding protein